MNSIEHKHEQEKYLDYLKSITMAKVKQHRTNSGMFRAQLFKWVQRFCAIVISMEKCFLKEFDYLSFIFNGERNEKKSKSFMGDSSNDENEINVPKGMGSKFACIFSVVMQMDLCWLNSIIRGIQKQNT